MGIDPNVRVLPFKKELRYPDIDALLNGEYARCAPGSVGSETARAVLCHHFTQDQDDSRHAALRYHGGVVWRVPPGTAL